VLDIQDQMAVVMVNGMVMVVMDLPILVVVAVVVCLILVDQADLEL
jgi:hypothetical protein